MGQKLGFWGRELGHHLRQCRLSRGYIRTKWNLNPSSRLATNMGRKLAAVPLIFFGGGELGPNLTCRLGRGLALYQVES